MPNQRTSDSVDDESTVLQGDLVFVLRFADSTAHRSQFQLPRAAIETLNLSCVCLRRQ